MHSAKVILGLSVMSVAATCNAAITWKSNTASSSWGDAASWDSTPLFDGTEDAIFDNVDRTGTADLVTLLNGDRHVNSVSFAASKNNARYSVRPGTPAGKLILESGNLTINSNGFTSFNANFGSTTTANNTTIRVDGGNSATPAEWSVNTTSTQIFGGLEGSAARVIRLSGNTSATTQWTGDSSEFYGVIRNELNASTSSNTKMNIQATNALGGVGSKLIVSSTYGSPAVGNGNLHFNSNASTSAAVSTSHEMDIQFDVRSFIASGIAAGTPSPIEFSTATLNGNLSGAGDIDFGVQLGASSVMRFGRIVVNGPDNTATGNVILRGGRLQVDGRWMDAGNFTVNRGLLGGTGSIGLASGKAVTVLATGSSYDPLDPFSSNAAISPADAGVVGTLEIGTVGNSNSLSFSNGNGAANPGAVTRYTQFFVDVDQLAADRLNVNGDVTIGDTQVQLVLNKLSSTHDASQFVILAYTGTLTGTFQEVYYDGLLISDPTAPGAIGGKYSLSYGTGSNSAIALIPEPTVIAGLALVVGPLARRRRRH